MKKILFVLLLISQSAQAAQVVQGPAKVIDGDTVEVNGTRIRLKGVDAPELSHPSGIEAKLTMQTIAGACGSRRKTQEELLVGLTKEDETSAEPARWKRSLVTITRTLAANGAVAGCMSS